MDLKLKGKSLSAYEVLGYLAIIIGILLIVFGMIMFKMIGNSTYINQEDMNRYGQFGEFIGGIVGSFWALAGVLLFFATLTYQKKEFEAQRFELEKTQKIFKQQDFSTLFLSFIAQHNNYINSLTGKAQDSSDWKGSSFFVLFKTSVMSDFYTRVEALDKRKRNPIALKSLFNESFNVHFKAYQYEIEPYLKNLRLLFDIVYKYRNETLDKSDYYSYILKSTISENELFIIYHVSLFDVFVELKKYHRIFNLFENLGQSSRMEYIIEKAQNLIKPEDTKSEVNPKADV